MCSSSARLEEVQNQEDKRPQPIAQDKGELKINQLLAFEIDYLTLDPSEKDKSNLVLSQSSMPLIVCAWRVHLSVRLPSRNTYNLSPAS